MPKIYPQKLQSGDEIRVIAPSRSFAIISEELRNIASDRFSKLGLKVSFGSHIEENNDFASSSIKSRIEDIHAAFSDKNVKAIITVLGGFNSNQLLRYLDWEIIKNNPKILCGFSDITALNNAIFAKTGLVSYSGPHYSTFGQKLYFEYTLDYFKKCLFSDAPFKIIPSNEWSDDAWYINQEERNLVKNNGFLMINQGQARGTIIGANLCTFNLLQGTEYFPSLTDSILFIEDDEESSPVHFDRDLQSLIHLPNFKEVEGIVIGRFQNASKISDEILVKIIKTKKELDSIPVLANVDFGHTSPIITFPIGGEAELEVGQSTTKLTVTKH
ncbi:MAG: Peptidase U61 LD-carboxypeptidase A [Berkelbacteria bacterium GW2011_GWA2_38_9]|uniref:Peptidase U61 LD-carboxypeptidase A n=1 Tax=Berkelbacteria bacterium GW2011_GWA2_38_9 TaxID=1618334 RepID=A0A0G0NLG8_9BACT|nr:MAG: Peptidase U61 LD-carboxypeptidase A [Berkelbacteria bacterium GW2011_GWA2_38_9]